MDRQPGTGPEEGDAPEVLTPTVVQPKPPNGRTMIVPQAAARSIATQHEMTSKDILAQVHKIQEVMRDAMFDGEHYGIIPGTDKPTLYKPGAEKLLLLFRLAPSYVVDTIREGEHLTVTSTCTLTHSPTGQVWGAGMGLCTTKESKYAWRKGGRICPECKTPNIKKSKNPPTGKPNDPPGWYCYEKIGGCGYQFPFDFAGIVNQEGGRVQNPDLADCYNTVLKIGNKRALVAAILNVTAASDIFIQDLGDMEHDVTPVDTEPQAQAPRPAAPTSAPPPVYTREPVQESGQSRRQAPPAARATTPGKPAAAYSGFATEKQAKMLFGKCAVAKIPEAEWKGMLAAKFGEECADFYRIPFAAVDLVKSWIETGDDFAWSK